MYNRYYLNNMHLNFPRKLKMYSLYGILSLVGLLVMTLINSYFGKTLVLSRYCSNDFSNTSKYLRTCYIKGKQTKMKLICPSQK